MRRASRLGVVLCIAVMGLSACSSDVRLRDLRDSAAGPEEFSVLPTRPLETPASYSDLPAPTPGQVNRADINPHADAIAALGGNPSRLADTGVPSADSALVASASRYGVPADIRATTSAEDAEFRKRRGRFTNIRLFRVDRYAQVYSPQTLDSHRALETFRQSGRITPTAPPN